MTDPLTIEVLRGGLVESRHQVHAVIADANGQVLDAWGRRFGVTRAFQIACIVEAIGVVSSVVWVSIPGLFVAAAFLGGTFMGITALGLMAARALSGDHPRRVLATMTAAFGLGQIVGPIVAGYGFDLTGSFLVSSLVAAVGLCISAALTVVVGRS